MKTTKQMNSELLEKFPFLEIISEYTGANNKVKIRCNDCGYEWEAIPRSVKSSKYGCPKCKLSNAKVENSKDKFLQKYNKDLYELIKFENCMNVTVKCKKCGYIRTTNASNIYRYGCPSCGHKNTADKQRMTEEEFINRAKLIHNNKYNYDKVNYINWSTPVIITCPIHGDFAQTPGKHLLGSNGIPQGCPKCQGRYKTTEEVISLCKNTHGDKYDYSKVLFINNNTPISIICKKHGEFLQLPYVHYKMGCGCPKCSQSHGEEEISLVLDSLNIDYKPQFRINNPYKENKSFVLDFYLPKYNTIIEYNGKLHYTPINFFGGKLRYDKLIERDNDLRQYCMDNNIKLLEIKYNNSDIKNNILLFLSIAA